MADTITTPIAPAESSKSVIAEVVSSQNDTETPSNETITDSQDLVPQEPWQTSPLFYELSNFLSVQPGEYEGMADKISVITDYAIEQAKSNKVEDIMTAIRELEDKLQPPPWGEKRVNHIYNALRMEARYQASKKAMAAFSRTGKWE